MTGAALGSGELYDRVPELPIEFRPASYTHAPEVLARLRSFVSVNSAIEVDLSGQVGRRDRPRRICRRRRRAGGLQPGRRHHRGALDHRAAVASRPAQSTITAALERRCGHHRAQPTSTTVVTEHGVAQLTGATLAERARRLIAVAAPEYRDELERATSGLTAKGSR